MTWNVLKEAKKKDKWYNKKVEYKEPNIIFDYPIFKDLQELPCHIIYNKDIDKEYDIIRSSVHDGTLIFSLELIGKVFHPILNMQSCYKKTYNNEILYSICYEIGDLKISVDYNDKDSPLCLREVVSLPVRCYYMKTEQDYNNWIKDNT